MHFSVTLFASASLTLANAAVLGSRSLSGEATYYGGNLAGGACSFSTYTLPSDVFGTALSDSNWDTSGNCGACVSVTGPSGDVITAMIVDECPGCGTNHLDLFPDAFSTLADPFKGVIDVTWEFVDCPISSPLIVHNKEGVSAYWFSMQVVNANKGVKSLEVSTDGGSTWQATARQDYNFFENSLGFGTTTVDVKVTSVDGDVVVVNSVEVSSGASTTASSNFGFSGSSEPAPSSSAAPVVSSTPLKTEEAVVSTPAPTPTPETTTESPAETTPTTLPGANFQQSIQTIIPTYATYAAVITNSAEEETATSSPSISTYATTTLKSTATLSKTKTKTKCSSVTPSTTAIPVKPTSAAGGITNSTTIASTSTYSTSYPTTYLISSVGASSSASSAAGGNIAAPTTTSIPFTGSATQSAVRIGSIIAGLGLAVLAAF